MKAMKLMLGLCLMTLLSMATANAHCGSCGTEHAKEGSAQKCEKCTDAKKCEKCTEAKKCEKCTADKKCEDCAKKCEGCAKKACGKDCTKPCCAKKKEGSAKKEGSGK